MVSFPPLYHGAVGAIYAGVAIWEMYIAQSVYLVEGMNDLARCFTWTMSIMNILLSTGSWYLFIQQFKKDNPSTSRISINAATGVSLWGIFMYFKFYELILPAYQSILLAETCLFFIRFGLASIIICSARCTSSSSNSEQIDMG